MFKIIVVLLENTISDKTHQNVGVPISPAVRNALIINGITDWSKIMGTGPKGRILKGDVLKFAGRILLLGLTWVTTINLTNNKGI
jgi:hypothetical protein